MEQLVLEQFSAEPPFGGSNIINAPLFNTPYLQQDGTIKSRIRSTEFSIPPRGQPVDWARYRPILLYGQFQPHLRTQYSTQYNLNIQRELTKDLVLQVGYVGSQGHRLLASHDVNFGNCADLPRPAQHFRLYGDGDLDVRPVLCRQLVLHSRRDGMPRCRRSICPTAQWTTVIPAGSTSVAPTESHWSACGRTRLRTVIRSTGTGCPQDGTPVFSSIFAEDTIANSNYNSLQASLEKRFSHGLQAQVAYTFSKSFDQASSFEGELNPLDPHGTYSLSQFDARHRLVFSYVWQLPIPKYSGFAGKVLNGWDVSGIYTYQTGFPIRITSSADNELMYSAFFEYPGEPNQLAPFHKNNPKTNGGYWFDPNSFTENASDDHRNLRVPTGPSFNCLRSEPVWADRQRQAHHLLRPANQQHGFRAAQGVSDCGENKRFEFRAEFFNLFNHTQFNNPDGNTTDGSDFGRIMRAKRPAPDSVGIEVLLLAGKR